MTAAMTAAGGLALVLLSSLAFAQGQAQRFTFSALDLDLDYRLTREEAEPSWTVSRNFDNADLDGDRRLSPLEFNNLALALSVRSGERGRAAAFDVDPAQ